MSQGRLHKPEHFLSQHLQYSWELTHFAIIYDGGRGRGGGGGRKGRGGGRGDTIVVIVGVVVVVVAAKVKVEEENILKKREVIEYEGR